jgi:hypothetical protein
LQGFSPEVLYLVNENSQSTGVEQMKFVLTKTLDGKEVETADVVARMNVILKGEVIISSILRVLMSF